MFKLLFGKCFQLIGYSLTHALFFISPFEHLYSVDVLQFDKLELDRFAKPLVNCPLLLDSASYFPDTVDLTQDSQARSYWLTCFEDATEKVPHFDQFISMLFV